MADDRQRAVDWADGDHFDGAEEISHKRQGNVSWARVHA